MVKNSGWRLFFKSSRLRTIYLRPIRPNFKLSLLGILVGIFLLPNLAYMAAITPENLIELTNRERLSAGLNALTTNQQLTEAAKAKGEAIIETQTFKHTINDKKFSGWVREAGYDYSYVGENLAIDFTTSEGVITAWENSPLHKKNLLSPFYQEIGLAAVNGEFQGQDTTVVVQIFGAPAIGSVNQPASAFGSNYLDTNLFSSKNLVYQPFGPTENLLTRSIFNNDLFPAYGYQSTLPASENLSARVNKFMIQPEFYAGVADFAVIFIFFALIYLLAFLYYYSFLKIKNLFLPN